MNTPGTGGIAGAPTTGGPTNSGGANGGNASTGEQVAGAAKEKASAVSSVATDQAGQLASTAADQARQVGSEAAAQAQNLVHEAKRSAWRQGETQTEQVAQAIGRLRDQAAALLDGRPEDAGPLLDHGTAVVERLDRMAGRLQSGGLEGAVRDLQRFARRRPAAFLAGAGVLGFAAGRLIRAGRDGSSEGPEGGYEGYGGYANGVGTGAGGTGVPAIPRPAAVDPYPAPPPPSIDPYPAPPAVPRPADPTVPMPGSGFGGTGAPPPPPTAHPYPSQPVRAPYPEG